MFQSQNAYNQGVDAPRRSYSTVKHRNEEWKHSERNPLGRAFALATLRCHALIWNNQTTLVNALIGKRKDSVTGKID